MTDAEIDARKRDLYRMIVGLSDMQAAHELARLGRTQLSQVSDPDRLLTPLIELAIIAYARPFTENSPYGPLGKKWSTFDSSERHHSHEKLLEFRHTVLAHSDADKRQVVIVPPGADHPGRPGTSTEIGWSTSRHTHLASEPKFADIAVLSEDVGRRLERKVHTEVQVLFGNRDLPPYAFDIFTEADVFGSRSRVAPHRR